ncbi:hypothetical protein HBN50_00805 [Halobacteriovorax sp. GB3]|uniref:TrlF family AAA-like ATPase n=1 Tax=Halobacteriovorax sp. GB3 TaxID=2719615 RepID=UPI00235E088D|nr:hypothetical protein [Halobacteriovorax sp. GB3]MDD0851605.1 hypothetical protein [Halobacteriovorax sp. GB3]
MRFKFAQGAVWRRWDLHIHSPDSVLANRFEGNDYNDKWDKYLECLEAIKDISVVGVTDYYSVSGYKKVRQFKSEGRLSNIDLFLPNVELRLDLRTQSNGTVNLHIIFNPKIVNELDRRFFSELKFEYSDKIYKCLRDDLIRLGRDFSNNQELPENEALKCGTNQFKVSLTELKRLLKTDNDLRLNSFIIVPNSSTDGNSGIQESGFAAYREEIYRLSDAIFSGNPNDRKYFLGESCPREELDRKYGGLKPCVHGSDAHSLIKVGRPDQYRNCWIKSDPSFEGLKQIVLEPSSRVAIQKDNPLFSFKRSYFSEFVATPCRIFNESYVSTSDFKIPLNPYMVSIIGGRGTGKSILLDLLKRTFFDSSTGRFSKIIHNDFRVSVTKTDGEENDYALGEENYLDYLHVSQGDVKAVVDDAAKLDVEIKRMLGMPSDDIEISNENLKQIEKIVEVKGLFEVLDEEGNQKHSKDKLLKDISKHKKLIKTITTDENQELIERYRLNESKIGKIDKSLLDKAELEKQFEEFSKHTKNVIEKLNMITDTIDIPLPDFSKQVSKLEELGKYQASRAEEIEKENIKIKDDLKSRGVDGDISYLLDKVKEYQVNINHSEKEIDKIVIKENEYKMQFEELKQSTDSMRQRYDEYIADITSRWNELKNGKDTWSEEQKELNAELISSVEVSGELIFDVEKFYEKLLEGLNKGKFRASKGEDKYSKAVKVFGVDSYQTFIDLLSNKKMINVDDGEPLNLESFVLAQMFVKNGESDFLKTLFSSDQREYYLKVLTRITYQGKKPDQLSVGQRGTFYLCLKLATNTFGSALVYDQPEDDLDNNFIVNELIPLLRKIKKYRQVILVTHNANVVVNSDSEQVIVASNIGEKLFYVSGSIENTFRDTGTQDALMKQGIKEHVCDTLEGGLNAFKAREKKYDL